MHVPCRSLDACARAFPELLTQGYPSALYSEASFCCQMQHFPPFSKVNESVLSLDARPPASGPSGSRSLHWSEKCCMLLVKKVEIFFTKIGFVYSKWSNLNAPGSYTSWCHLLLGSTVECPFLWMQEKGDAACGLVIKWKSS